MSQERHSGLCLVCLAAVIMILSGFSTVSEGAVQSQQQVDLDLEYYQINNNKFLSVSLAISLDDDSQAVPEEIDVNLYVYEMSQATKLGSITMERDGSVMFELGETFRTITDTLYDYRFIASLKDDERFVDTEARLTIRPTDLKIETFEDDSNYFVRATLMEMEATGDFIPVEWEELLFEVDRSFGLLTVADFGFTDEYGSVEIEYPDDIPGDDEGNIIIVVRLEEHPDYGNIIHREEVSWGIPVAIHTGIEEARSWMSRDAPLFFAIIFWGGLVAAFGAIGYVINNLFKINTTS